MMNGIEAMSDVEDERRILTIRGQRDELAGQPAVRITVHDLGGGFRPEDGDRLFEAFYTNKSHGLGMGLRMSRSIVEAHGGRLWATPNEGPGSDVFLCVARGYMTRRGGGREGEQRIMRQPDPIVVIIDDDASFRRSTERLIRSAGFTVS